MIAAAGRTGVHLEELGLLICVLGGAALLAGAIVGWRRVRYGSQGTTTALHERALLAVAGGLFVLGFLVALVGVHYR